MTSVDIGEVVFLVAVFAVTVGSFLKIMLKDETKK